MKLTVDSVKKVSDGKFQVEGSCSNGTLAGIWSSSVEPTAGDEYDVELNLPPVPLASLHKITNGDTAPVVSLGDGDKVLFTATCEDIDDDEAITLRFARNWMQTVETDSSSIKVGDTLHFEVSAAVIEIYPV